MKRGGSMKTVNKILKILRHKIQCLRNISLSSKNYSNTVVIKWLTRLNILKESVKMFNKVAKIYFVI